MNIVAVCGSPRKGNTEFALRQFLILAEEKGYRTDLVLLREKRIEHCRGCLDCKTNATCVISDDMTSILEKMKSADLVVLGSPNYFANFSGLMKDFIDRLVPLYHLEALKDKKLIMIFVGASNNPKVSSLAEELADHFKMTLVGDCYLLAQEQRDIEDNPSKKEEVVKFATQVL